MRPLYSRPARRWDQIKQDNGPPHTVPPQIRDFAFVRSQNSFKGVDGSNARANTRLKGPGVDCREMLFGEDEVTERIREASRWGEKGLSGN